MEQHEQESQQKASREHSSPIPRKHPVRREGETGDDRHHPHSSKGQSPMADSEVDPAQQDSGHGNSTVAKILLQRSVSEKDCSSDNRQTRGDSLVVLIKKFIDLIKQTEDGVLDLEIAQATLEVTRRRMYDITNRLESIDLIEKISKGRIRWKGPAGIVRSREETKNISSLQEEIETLKIQESTLDDRIREMEERLRNLREDENNQSRLHVTQEDIINLPCFQNEALILVKAPPGTSIQVPDPHEDGYFQERRYTLILQSNTGAIHLWLISPYEENLQTMNPDGEAQPNIPGTSSANENASVSPLTEEIRERTGAADASSPRDWWTELFKGRADDNDYGYLIHPDTDLSINAIADLWSEHEHHFDFLNDMQEIDILIDTSTPPAQPPPSATVMPSVSNTIAEIDWYCWESTCDDYTASTNTPQDQTLPAISTATPSVLNRIGDIGWDSLEMIHEDNATASISAPQPQTQPPINTAMPSIPNTIADIGWDSPEMIHEDNVMASISAPQAQSPPQINTAMPSVPNAIAEMGWDSMEMTHEDNAIADIGASQTQTPPPVNTAMPFVSNMIADNIIHEDNIMTNTNTTQAQTTQGCATAIASVSRITGSRNESVRRSMAEVSPNSETAEVNPAAHERAPIHKVYKRRAKAQVRRETVGHAACKEKE